MKLSKNIILSADSYKYSQAFQMPPNTEYIYSYIESRGGQWDATVFFGLQAFIKEYLTTPITKEDIDVAEQIITAHGEPFYREGWEYILSAYAGKLPVVIKAVPEGMIIPTRNVLVTIENTDPKCWWLTSFLETALLRAVWYPTTVATNSYEFKKIITKGLELTGDPTQAEWKLQDFGNRGVSSMESAGLGGMAHLVNFMGTDTVTALLYAKEYYGAEMAGFSVPASEHSSTTAWGREHEVDAYRNMIKQFGKPGAILSVVSDSYDIYKACEMFGTVLKDEIIASGATFVVRPDSGVPSEVVVKCLYILEKYFGSVTNTKGFRVLNTCRVLQGDGIDHATVRSILFCMEMAGFSADNVVFGSGGKLLQALDRDTMRFAMKASSIGIREDIEVEFTGNPDVGGSRTQLVYHDVFKDPITDSGKTSKKGRVTLWTNGGEYESSVTRPTRWTDKGTGQWIPILKVVFKNGELKNEITFDEVRANARK